jgi:hypothetical protein
MLLSSAVCWNTINERYLKLFEYAPQLINCAEPYVKKGLRSERQDVQRRAFIAFSDLAILIALKNQPLLVMALTGTF